MLGLMHSLRKQHSVSAATNSKISLASRAASIFLTYAREEPSKRTKKAVVLYIGRTSAEIPSEYGGGALLTFKVCVILISEFDWLHANEGPRTYYTGSHTTKCVMLCLLKHLKQPKYALQSHSACSKKRKNIFKCPEGVPARAANNRSFNIAHGMSTSYQRLRHTINAKHGGAGQRGAASLSREYARPYIAAPIAVHAYTMS
eukprot:6179962-Pleurochrysis_carterae.AAC.1